ncbi:MAG: sterol desaturase family protein [Candidatus Poseidoniaceae archaeon]
MVMSMFASGALLLATGGIFHLLENRNPLEKIDRKKHLKFDFTVIAISSLIVAGMTIWLLDGFVRTWLTENVQLFEAVISQPLGLRILLALIIGDFGYYIAHRLMHTAPLWRTHVFHHSIQQIYWFSGLRTSAMNSLIIRLPYLIGMCMFAIPAPTVAVIAICLGAVNFWVHSNLNVSLGPLNYVFITPPFHRTHHSMADAAMNRNFGNILSCWDYLFGSAVQPTEELNVSEKGFEIESEHVIRQIVGV